MKGRIDSYFTELKAVERAEVMPDAYWSNFRELLAKDFEVGWNVLDGTAGRPGLTTSGEVSGYLDRANRFGRSGNPHGEGPGVPGGRRSLQDDAIDMRTEGDLSPSARALLDAARPQNSLFNRRLVALVLIAQGEDGSVESIELAESSGNPDYDRLALARAASISGKELGPPPAQGHKTLWAFNTSFKMVPPVPVVGCSLDLFFIPRECFWPLKRSVKSQLKLRAIY